MCALHLSVNKVDYLFESKINFERSTIYHFIVSDKLCRHITEYSVRHEGDNLSDHHPIILKLDVPMV